MEYKSRNLTMMTDLYELTMMYGYFKKNMTDTEAVFDLFFRELDGQRSYAVMAGTESVIDYINNLEFTDDDICYLRSLNLFDEDRRLLLNSEESLSANGIKNGSRLILV